ncbi:hypothetical protein QFZ22_000937 [Streptomyces canus]|uniref:Uncharacterized protein n=1 Tax=Streptomyces canus TaxID=58343 RepID=A0AAW8F470_9ACTN|nr:hypothetical protein [Streptomyces canus]
MQMLRSIQGTALLQPGDRHQDHEQVAAED